MNSLYAPWPWYSSGVMIAFIMFLLLKVGKSFGMSSNLKTLCTICGAGNKVSFFNFDWKENKWSLIVVLGAIIGGFIASKFLTQNFAVDINAATIENLNTLGFKSAGKAYLPIELYSNKVFYDVKGLLLLAIGGLLVGFGARYANGCTSGHAISGLSNLQLPSLIAVIGFFIGGLVMVYVIFPLIF